MATGHPRPPPISSLPLGHSLASRTGLWWKGHRMASQASTGGHGPCWVFALRLAAHAPGDKLAAPKPQCWSKCALATQRWARPLRRPSQLPPLGPRGAGVPGTPRTSPGATPADTLGVERAGSTWPCTKCRSMSKISAVKSLSSGSFITKRWVRGTRVHLQAGDLFNPTPLLSIANILQNVCLFMLSFPASYW